MRELSLKGFFAPGERVLCAVSGGADSTALLLLLRDEARRGAIELCAAHLNHGIRGAEADADEAFVRSLCEKWGVWLIRERLDVPRAAREAGEGLETAARRLRYGFLRAAKQRAGADTIATAHHAGDQAETVLMHLLRGASLRGASGMRPREGDLARPLLAFSKEELVNFLLGRGVGWREDASNGDPGNPRNFIRLRALPLLEEAYPRAREALCRFAAVARTEDLCLRELTESYLAANLEAGPYGRRLRLSPVHEAVLKRAVGALCPDADFRLIEGLAALAGERRGRLCARGVDAERAGDFLYLKKPHSPPPELPFADGAALSGLGRLRVRPCPPIPARDNGPRQVLRAAALRGAALRTRRAGDRMRPLGAGGERLLSDLFTDRKIDSPLRDFVPLVARGGEILWAVGVAIAESVKVSEGDEALEVSWIPQKSHGNE